ncbi:MAG: hypothetical protein OXT74_11900 [Candidatus Poribacteria bacterium]|nr:hypothetical protein [Candidatus Poribacteria bacterium]
MKSRERLCWVVACSAAVGMAIGLCVSPLTAQRDIFGEIKCTKLSVTNSDGKDVLVLSAKDGNGSLEAYSTAEKPDVVMGGDSDGGFVVVAGKDGMSGVIISVKDGVSIVIQTEDRVNSGILLHVPEDGAEISAGVVKHGRLISLLPEED